MVGLGEAPVKVRGEAGEIGLLTLPQDQDGDLAVAATQRCNDGTRCGGQLAMYQVLRNGRINT